VQQRAVGPKSFITMDTVLRLSSSVSDISLSLSAPFWKKIKIFYKNSLILKMIKNNFIFKKATAPAY